MVFASVHHHDFDANPPCDWDAGKGQVEDGVDHTGKTISDSGEVDADVSKMHDGAIGGEGVPSEACCVVDDEVEGTERENEARGHAFDGDERKSRAEDDPSRSAVPHGGRQLSWCGTMHCKQ